MKLGRSYYLAYHHPKARVRKKNRHRFEREVRLRYKRSKCFFKCLPDCLKTELKEAPYMVDYPNYYRPTNDWWWSRQPPAYCPYPFLNVYGAMVYHPPL